MKPDSLIGMDGHCKRHTGGILNSHHGFKLRRRLLLLSDFASSIAVPHTEPTILPAYQAQSAISNKFCTFNTLQNRDDSACLPCPHIPHDYGFIAASRQQCIFRGRVR